MKKIATNQNSVLAVLLCLGLAVSAWAGTVTGQVGTVTGGSLANGTLTFNLSQPMSSPESG